MLHAYDEQKACLKVLLGCTMLRERIKRLAFLTGITDDESETCGKVFKLNT